MRSRWVRFDHGKSRSANESLRTIKSKQSLGKIRYVFFFFPHCFPANSSGGLPYMTSAQKGVGQEIPNICGQTVKLLRTVRVEGTKNP